MSTLREPATTSGATPVERADTSPEALERLAERVAITAAYYDESGEFPWAGIQAVHDAGVLRLGIGERFGGQRVSHVEIANVLQALGGADASVALITAQTIAQHAAQDRTGFWPEDLYRTVVEQSLTQPVVLNAVRAEPEWGAPARGGLPATTVTRTESGWVLSGRKAYATASEGLTYHLVWAVDHGAGPDATPRVAHAVVPADAPGIEIVRTWDHLGLRASSTHDVIYRDVEIPLENFRGVDPATVPDDANGHVSTAVSFIALYVGVARAAGRFFAQFASERVPTSLGRPIATLERIQSVAGEVEAQLLQAEAVLGSVARQADSGEPVDAGLVLASKLLVTRSAIAAVQAAVAAIGNPALTRHNPLERHLRDVLCSRVHPPQDDAALLRLGRRALGVTSTTTSPGASR